MSEGDDGTAGTKDTMTSPVPGGPLESDSIELRVPADPAYLAVIRTAAAGLALRLDLTMDEIEDLRIAVDEACALLLQPERIPGASLTTVFTSRDGALDVEVSGPAVELPDRDSFAWAVLEALVGSVRTGRGATADGTPATWIRLTRDPSRTTA